MQYRDDFADEILKVGETVDAAAFFFLSLDKTCHAQLLVDAAAQGSGHKKTFIGEEEARDSYEQVGLPSKGKSLSPMRVELS